MLRCAVRGGQGGHCQLSVCAGLVPCEPLIQSEWLVQGGEGYWQRRMDGWVTFK